MKLKIEVLDQDGNVKTGKNEYEDFTREMSAVGEDYVHLATQDLVYNEGDRICVGVDKENVFLVVKLDETLDSTLVYLTDSVWEYRIPLSDGDVLSQPDGAFKGKSHYICVRVARDWEVGQYRNLAFNPHDQKESTGVYPHAVANVETRNDSTFFAKNVINGVYANLSHGPYPYQSWGINRQADAEVRIEFGRPVQVDSVGLVLRADFPHDSYWEEVTLRFSDGHTEVLKTVKSAQIQTFSFEMRTVTSVTLCNLKKADDESPFPALTEFEVYGRD